MTLDEYQALANRTEQKDRSIHDRFLQNALGIAGEAGEVADLIKKWKFHGHAYDRVKLMKELGDCLWYLAGLASCADLTLSEVAEANIAKLKARYPDGFSNEASINRKPEE